MSSLSLAGDTSGAITVSAPAVAGTNTLTLQAATATSAVNTLGTAVASTSGTSIDFTGLPAWCKRVTVMLNSVSTSGTSSYLIQIGDSGGIETTGYVGGSGNRGGEVNSSAGFALIYLPAAASSYSGAITLTLQSGATWVASGVVSLDASGQPNQTAGSKTLSPGPLDRVRITTVGGTNTFDAGTINILYEG